MVQFMRLKDVNYDMKKIISTLIFAFFISSSFAQKKCSVLNANAFYSIPMPGNIPVDENGNPLEIKLNKNRVIFITSNCNIEPVIVKVLYDKTSPNFFIRKAKEDEVAKLEDEANNKIKLNVPKLSFIWKLTIVASSSAAIPENPTLITLLWKQKSKINTLVIKKELHLAALPTY
jgi:hypothetical protein